MSDKTEQFYDNYVTRQAAAGVNRRHHSIIKLCRRFGMRPSDHVLEIGCGIGTVSKLAAEYLLDGTIISVDISPQSIKYAQENITYANADFKVMDITSETLTGSFDFIILPDVLEHIPFDKHMVTFEKLSTVLTDNGRILIHIPNPHYLESIISKTPEMLQEVDQPLHTNKLIQSIYENNLYIFHLENYSLWVTPPDYQVIVLEKPRNFNYKDKPVKQSIISKLRDKFR